MMKRRSKQEWQTLIEEYEQSGEAQAAFAARKRVKLATLQNWLYRVRQEREEQPAFVKVAEQKDIDIVVEHGGLCVRFGAHVSSARICEVVVALSRC